MTNKEKQNEKVQGTAQFAKSYSENMKGGKR